MEPRRADADGGEEQVRHSLRPVTVREDHAHLCVLRAAQPPVPVALSPDLVRSVWLCGTHLIPFSVSLSNIEDGSRFWPLIGSAITSSLTKLFVRKHVPLPDLKTSAHFTLWLRHLRAAGLPKPVLFFDEADRLRGFERRSGLLMCLRESKGVEVQVRPVAWSC